MVNDILWLLALLTVIVLLDGGAVLLVRAEQRERDRVDAERRRSASLRRAARISATPPNLPTVGLSPEPDDQAERRGLVKAGIDVTPAASSLAGAAADSATPTAEAALASWGSS